MTSDVSAAAAGDLTTEQVMDMTAIPILEYGRAWMSAKATAQRGAELELAPGFGFWVNGRAGLLGEVDADLAAAAIGFMAPDSVRSLWGVRKQGVPLPEVTKAYAAAGAEWGRQTLADWEPADLERLTELCDKVAAAALPSSGMLFTGWRALERTGDPAADATVALNVLRELRGGAHLSAVHAAGLEPHGAIMSADDQVRGGPAGAERFGWLTPHPEPDKPRRAEAERLTSEICRPAYDVLSQTERSEFVALVKRARASFEA